MLNFISSMLGYDWTTNFPEGSDLAWVANIYAYLTPILYAIMAVVGAAGVIYSVVLGIQLAKAEDQSKRDEAKKRLITTVIAVAVTVVLIIFFNELFPLIIKAVNKTDNTGNLPNHQDFIHLFTHI